jgi:hypothetical protein
MNELGITPDIATSAESCHPAARVTRSLLGYGVIAGPLYVVVALVQALLRPGFDLMRDDASLLSNGSLGWIQIANFVVTGAMVVACAAGVHRALKSGLAAIWAPRLLALYGLGLVAAGLFVADPMNGFPPGTPAGRPVSMSLHGTLHIAAAGIAFLCLIAACFVLARRFATLGLASHGAALPCRLRWCGLGLVQPRRGPRLLGHAAGRVGMAGRPLDPPLSRRGGRVRSYAGIGVNDGPVSRNDRAEWEDSHRDPGAT